MKFKKHKKIIVLGVMAVAVVSTVGFGLARNGYFGGGDTIPEDTWTRGLVAAYNFDEGSGQTAYNAADTGSANNGTLGSSVGADSADPAWTRPELGDSLSSDIGPSGTALSFDGADDYVDCGNDASLDIISNITVSVWFYMSDSIIDSAVLNKRNDGTDHGYEIFAITEEGGLVCFRGNVQNTDLCAPILPNQWYHVVGVLNGSNGYLYLNGELVAAQGSLSLTASGENLKIGVSDTFLYFNGSVDDVRIYNRALSAEEVRYHYNRGAPVAHWKFDEGEGQTAYDETGNNNDGTLGGGTAAYEPTWVEGKHGSALSFDGANDYVEMGNVLDFERTDSFSVSAWIRLDDLLSDDKIISKMNVIAPYRGWRFEHWDGKLYFALRNDNSPANLISVNTPVNSISALIWYHVVVTYNGSSVASGVSFYINGISQTPNIEADSLSATILNSESLTIGANSGGPSGHFNGSIDDVRIYDYVRSPGEIRLDYNAGFAARFGGLAGRSDCSADPASCMDYGLVGYWNMDEGSGTTAYDASDNSNTGTLTNGPKWTNDTPPYQGGTGGGSSLQFDGADDYVDIGDITETSVKTIELWAKPSAVNVTEEVIDFNGTQYVKITNGTVSGENFTSPTVYVDGSAGTTVTADWHHIVITTDTGFSADDLDIGRLESSTYFNGAIDEVRIYNRALSAEEVRHHYNRGGPVAHWKFDEGEGVECRGLTPTIRGQTPNDSRGSIKSSALDFDGVNDYVNCGNDASLDIADGITIEAWVKTNDIAANQMIMCKYTNYKYDGFYINLFYGKLCFSQGFENSVITTKSVLYPFTQDIWHHMVIIKQGAAVTMYVDTIDVTDDKKSHTDIGTNTADLRIGIGETGSQPFNGSIDSVRIYNKALHATTIANHYKGDYGTYEKTTAEADLTADDLVLYIPFDDESGTTATNYGSCGGTPANCNGTLTTFADTSAKAGDSSDSGWAIDTDWTSGRQNTALEFGGTNGFFQSDNYIPTSSAFSHSLWFKSADGAYSANEYLFAQGDDDPSAYIDTSGNINVMGDDALKITSTATVLDTQWHHLEITADGTNLKLYLDGVEDGFIAYTGSSDDAGISAGAHISRSGFFDGVVDDFKVYNYARSPGEIRLDYNAGFAARFGGLAGRSDCSSDPASCMDYGLVASYDFDEGDGQTAYNAADTGSVNDGTLGSTAGADTNDPKYLSVINNQSSMGPSGSALSFDGANDYVNCGNNPSLNITDAITIEAWVKPIADTTGSFDVIIGKADAFYIIQKSTGNKIAMGLFGVSPAEVATTDSISQNQWTHIVCTYDKDAGANNYKQYWNGVLKKEQTSTGSISTSVNALGVGTYGAPSAYYFNGSIDQVRIYNRALSAEEVRYHYNRGGPVAHWKFDEGEGQTAYDETGNNNDGTLGGGTAAYEPTWVEGKHGTALSFDGSNDYVDCGDDSSLYSEDGSVEAWVKTTNDDYEALMCFGDTNGKAWFSIALGNNASSYLTDELITILTGNAENITVNRVGYTTDIRTELFDGNWHHIVVTAGSKYGIYLDGIPRTITVGEGADNGMYTDTVGIDNSRIGSINLYNLGDVYYFNGSIDEVRIYNYARSAAQILMDYNAGYAARLK